MNKWESLVVTRELARNKDSVWLRNLDRKPWSLTVPYNKAGKPTASYPDFIFVERVNGNTLVNLLDPHHIDFEDAPAKAAGLARYAAKHADAYNRIELIIVDKDGEICTIDLSDEAKREKVQQVTTKAHLAHLFEEDV